MGKIDEHWCSDCKKKLDKQKDEYLDMESIRLKLPQKKGIICAECLKKPEYDALRKLLETGNPNFRPFIECGLHAVCKTFKRVSSRPVRCGHIAVIGDTIYCKRRHPGVVKLPVERAERRRREDQLLIRAALKAFRNLPEPARTAAIDMFSSAVSNSWQPPSAVIAQPIHSGQSGFMEGSTEVGEDESSKQRSF